MRAMLTPACSTHTQLLGRRLDFRVRIVQARGVKWVQEDKTRGVMCRYKFYTDPKSRSTKVQPNLVEPNPLSVYFLPRSSVKAAASTLLCVCVCVLASGKTLNLPAWVWTYHSLCLPPHAAEEGPISWCCLAMIRVTPRCMVQAVKQTMNPDFNYTKQFTIRSVSEAFVEYLEKSALVVEMWGRQGKGAAFNRANSKRPTAAAPAAHALLWHMGGGRWGGPAARRALT